MTESKKKDRYALLLDLIDDGVMRLSLLDEETGGWHDAMSGDHVDRSLNAALVANK